MRRILLALLLAARAASADYTLPADRATTWNPGLNAVGGIPTRTTICSTLSPIGGGSDDTSAIQSAINSCTVGQVVKLNAGTFLINTGNYILLNKGVTLRGSGPDATILSKTNGATQGSPSPGGNASPVIIIGPLRYGLDTTSTNLTANAVKGEYTVTVTSATGLSVGTIVLLDELSGAGWQTDPAGRGNIWASSDWRVIWQLHDPAFEFVDDPLIATTPTTGDAASWFCRQDRPTSEIHKIAAVDGTTITFEEPIHISYRTANTAQLSYYNNAHTTQAGLEDLKVSGGDDANVRFIAASESWVKNVDVTSWLGEGIEIKSSHRIEVRDSYIHHCVYPSPGGGCYAVSLSNGSSEFLFENSISRMVNKVMVSRSSGAGSVVGYNYTDQGYIFYSENWHEVGLNGSHMVGPHHMLFEGNYSWNADSDHTHGTSVFNTYFRNHLRGVRSSFVNIDPPGTGATVDDVADGGAPARAGGLQAGSYWMSFVGNVMGASGLMSGWSYEINGAFSGDAIWKLGWDGWSPYPVDTVVTTNTTRGVIRDGNYDYVSNEQRWHGIGGAIGDGTPATLPNSMYLSGKPRFFNCGDVWPWVEPGGATKLYTLPAQRRFIADTPFEAASPCLALRRRRVGKLTLP